MKKLNKPAVARIAAGIATMAATATSAMAQTISAPDLTIADTGITPTYLVGLAGSALLLFAVFYGFRAVKKMTNGGK